MSIKGVNTFEFNTATMIEIVQHYFKTVLFADGKSPIVSNVEHTKQGYALTFTITTGETNGD